MRVGKITVGPRIERESYEVAAWFKAYDCPRQTVDVFLSKTGDGWPQFLSYTLKGKCVDACLISMFGGVAYGTDPAGREAIGKEGNVCVNVRAYYAHKMKDLELEDEYKWLLDENSWPREVANEKLRKAIENGWTWDVLNRMVNTEWLKNVGSPELVEQVASK